MLPADIGGFHGLTLEDIGDPGNVTGPGDVGEHGDAMPVEVVEVLAKDERERGRGEDLLEAGLPGQSLGAPSLPEVAAARRGELRIGRYHPQAVLPLDIAEEDIGLA